MIACWVAALMTLSTNSEVDRSRLAITVSASLLARTSARVSACCSCRACTASLRARSRCITPYTPNPTNRAVSGVTTVRVTMASQLSAPPAAAIACMVTNAPTVPTTTPVNPRCRARLTTGRKIRADG